MHKDNYHTHIKIVFHHNKVQHNQLQPSFFSNLSKNNPFNLSFFSHMDKHPAKARVMHTTKKNYLSSIQQISKKILQFGNDELLKVDIDEKNYFASTSSFFYFKCSLKDSCMMSIAVARRFLCHVDVPSSVTINWSII